MDIHQIWREAKAAGVAAGNACTPKPMIVQRVDPVTNAVIKTYEPVMDGMCGFAYVKIRPARGPLVAWLKANRIGYKAYNGGWEISIHEHDQSWERKTAHASALAKVLVQHGINASSHSRMD